MRVIKNIVTHKSKKNDFNTKIKIKQFLFKKFQGIKIITQKTKNDFNTNFKLYFLPIAGLGLIF